MHESGVRLHVVPDLRRDAGKPGDLVTVKGIRPEAQTRQLQGGAGIGTDGDLTERHGQELLFSKNDYWPKYTKREELFGRNRKRPLVYFFTNLCGKEKCTKDVEKICILR